MKIFKYVMKIILGIVLASTVLVGVYVGYFVVTYSRLGNVEVTVEKEAETTYNQVTTNTNYTLSTYNIGFGAYNPQFSFFMDSGQMIDEGESGQYHGEYVSGISGKAASKNAVLASTYGVINTMNTITPDFMFFQEVDVQSTRSHFVNQQALLVEEYQDYQSTFSKNFHCAYIAYPFNDPMGAVQSGLLTLSKYDITSSNRVELPIASDLSKFTDLDRCIVINRFAIQGSEKELVMINLHLSAYDEGGLIRQGQLETLAEIMAHEYRLGNYVIAGGDWNEVLTDLSITNSFATKQVQPDWVYYLNKADLNNVDLAMNNFDIVAGTNKPTCRSSDIPYAEGINYTCVIDGFIVSDNVQNVSITNIDNQFAYSDHQPAVFTFSLEG